MSADNLWHDAELQAKEDLQHAHASGYWDNAVTFLRTELATAAPEIRAAIAKGGPYGWVAPYHHGWGTAVRNLLRKAGYGEKAMNVENLDNIYVELVEDAMKES